MPRLIFFGHDTLRQKAADVSTIDEALLKQIDAMFNVMYSSNGIGLAAPQINISRRVIIIDISDKTNVNPMALINPVIKSFSDETEPYEEGCLSIPGISRDVIRPSEIQVSAISPDGSKVTFEAGGLLARVIQHEVDHLDGILFIDRLEDYVKNEIRSDLKKIKKMSKAS
jgi:peptide deformylase